MRRQRYANAVFAWDGEGGRQAAGTRQGAWYGIACEDRAGAAGPARVTGGQRVRQAGRPSPYPGVVPGGGRRCRCR
jgi:hypothetical protein